jgi:hypothetical protein
MSQETQGRRAEPHRRPDIENSMNDYINICLIIENSSMIRAIVDVKKIRRLLCIFVVN